MNDYTARDIEDSYSQFRILLSKLELNVNVRVVAEDSNHHFMRMGEFYFCEKWGLSDNTKA